VGEIVGTRSLGRLGGWEIRSTAFVVASAEVQAFTLAVPIYIVDKPQFLHSLLCLLISLCCVPHIATFFRWLSVLLFLVFPSHSYTLRTLICGESSGSVF
jgi:hypothetical protein